MIRAGAADKRIVAAASPHSGPVRAAGDDVVGACFTVDGQPACRFTCINIFDTAVSCGGCKVDLRRGCVSSVDESVFLLRSVAVVCGNIVVEVEFVDRTSACLADFDRFAALQEDHVIRRIVRAVFDNDLRGTYREFGTFTASLDRSQRRSIDVDDIRIFLVGIGIRARPEFESGNRIGAVGFAEVEGVALFSAGNDAVVARSERRIFTNVAGSDFDRVCSVGAVYGCFAAVAYIEVVEAGERRGIHIHFAQIFNRTRKRQACVLAFADEVVAAEVIRIFHARYRRTRSVLDERHVGVVLAAARYNLVHAVHAVIRKDHRVRRAGGQGCGVGATLEFEARGVRVKNVCAAGFVIESVLPAFDRVLAFCQLNQRTCTLDVRRYDNRVVAGSRQNAVACARDNRIVAARAVDVVNRRCRRIRIRVDDRAFRADVVRRSQRRAACSRPENVRQRASVVARDCRRINFSVCRRAERDRSACVDGDCILLDLDLRKLNTRRAEFLRNDDVAFTEVVVLNLDVSVIEVVRSVAAGYIVAFLRVDGVAARAADQACFTCGGRSVNHVCARRTRVDFVRARRFFADHDRALDVRSQNRVCNRICCTAACCAEYHRVDRTVGEVDYRRFYRRRSGFVYSAEIQRRTHVVADYLQRYFRRLTEIGIAFAVDVHAACYRRVTAHTARYSLAVCESDHACIRRRRADRFAKAVFARVNFVRIQCFTAGSGRCQ